CLFSRSRLMFRRRTATLRATTPVSSTANAVIQTIPPLSRLPCARLRGRGRGAASEGRRGIGVATSGANQSRAATTSLLPSSPRRGVGRARAAAFLVAQEVLDDPILERVERDHGETTARPEHLECGGKCGLERAQLVVDGDAQRLEHALRRMTLAEACGCGYRGLDRVDELAGPLERLILPSLHARTPFSESCSSTAPKSPRSSRACTPAPFSNRVKYVRAAGSRSIAINLPRPLRSAASRDACPPAPKVASTTVSPGRTARLSRT